MNKFLDKLKTLILPADYHADNDNYNKWLEICKIAGTTPDNETAIAITIALNMHEAFNNDKKAQETILTALSFYHNNDDDNTVSTANTTINTETTTISTVKKDTANTADNTSINTVKEDTANTHDNDTTSTNNSTIIANLNPNNANSVSNASTITTVSNTTSNASNANNNHANTPNITDTDNSNLIQASKQQVNNTVSTANTVRITSNSTVSTVNASTVNTDKSGKTSDNSLNSTHENKKSKESYSIKKISNPKEFGDTVKTLSTIIEQNCSKLGYTSESEKSIIKTKPYKKYAKIIGNVNITSILALIKTGMPAGMKPSKTNTNDTISRRILSMTAKPITRTEFIQTILWFNGKCAYCGCEMKKSGNSDKCRTADHIIPMALDYNNGGMGETAFGNIILVCRKCNSAKDNMTLDNWIETKYKDNPELGNVIKHNIQSFMNYTNYYPMSKNTAKFAYNEINQLMKLEQKYTPNKTIINNLIVNTANRIKEYKNGKRGDKLTKSAIKNIAKPLLKKK